MGTADLMPGISGGTIALILGVYKELIKSIDSINLKNLKEIKNKGFKRKTRGKLPGKNQKKSYYFLLDSL